MEQLLKELSRWRSRLLEAIDREKALMSSIAKEHKKAKRQASSAHRLPTMGGKLQKAWKDQEIALAKIGNIRKRIEEILNQEIEL